MRQGTCKMNDRQTCIYTDQLSFTSFNIKKQMHQHFDFIQMKSNQKVGVTVQAWDNSIRTDKVVEIDSTVSKVERIKTKKVNIRVRHETCEQISRLRHILSQILQLGR